jgi:hypothetical protein
MAYGDEYIKGAFSNGVDPSEEDLEYNKRARDINEDYEQKSTEFEHGAFAKSGMGWGSTARNLGRQRLERQRRGALDEAELQARKLELASDQAKAQTHLTQQQALSERYKTPLEAERLRQSGEQSHAQSQFTQQQALSEQQKRELDQYRWERDYLQKEKEQDINRRRLNEVDRQRAETERARQEAEALAQARGHNLATSEFAHRRAIDVEGANRDWWKTRHEVGQGWTREELERRRQDIDEALRYNDARLAERRQIDENERAWRDIRNRREAERQQNIRELYRAATEAQAAATHGAAELEGLAQAREKNADEAALGYDRAEAERVRNRRQYATELSGQAIQSHRSKQEIAQGWANTESNLAKTDAEMEKMRIDMRNEAKRIDMEQSFKTRELDLQLSDAYERRVNNVYDRKLKEREIADAERKTTLEFSLAMRRLAQVEVAQQALEVRKFELEEKKAIMDDTRWKQEFDEIRKTESRLNRQKFREQQVIGHWGRFIDDWKLRIDEQKIYQDAFNAIAQRELTKTEGQETRSSQERIARQAETGATQRTGLQTQSAERVAQTAAGATTSAARTAAEASTEVARTHKEATLEAARLTTASQEKIATEAQQGLLSRQQLEQKHKEDIIKLEKELEGKENVKEREFRRSETAKQHYHERKVAQDRFDFENTQRRLEENFKADQADLARKHEQALQDERERWESGEHRDVREHEKNMASINHQYETSRMLAEHNYNLSRDKQQQDFQKKLEQENRKHQKDMEAARIASQEWIAQEQNALTKEENLANRKAEMKRLQEQHAFGTNERLGNEAFQASQRVLERLNTSEERIAAQEFRLREMKRGAIIASEQQIQRHEHELDLEKQRAENLRTHTMQVQDFQRQENESEQQHRERLEVYKTETNTFLEEQRTQLQRDIAENENRARNRQIDLSEKVARESHDVELDRINMEKERLQIAWKASDNEGERLEMERTLASLDHEIKLADLQYKNRELAIREAAAQDQHYEALFRMRSMGEELELRKQQNAFANDMANRQFGFQVAQNTDMLKLRHEEMANNWALKLKEILRMTEKDRYAREESERQFALLVKTADAAQRYQTGNLKLQEFQNELNAQLKLYDVKVDLAKLKEAIRQNNLGQARHASALMMQAFQITNNAEAAGREFQSLAAERDTANASAALYNNMLEESGALNSIMSLAVGAMENTADVIGYLKTDAGRAAVNAFTESNKKKAAEGGGT